jgi:hypothetical protein
MGEVLGVVYKAEAEARLKDRTAERDAIDMALGQEHREKLDLEARLAAAEAGADGAHCVHDDCWLHGSHLGDAKRRIASLELELMRMTNDVDHRVADLETRLAAAEQRHIEPMAGCSCSACTQLRERGRS